MLAIVLGLVLLERGHGGNSATPTTRSIHVRSYPPACRAAAAVAMLVAPVVIGFVIPFAYLFTRRSSGFGSTACLRRFPSLRSTMLFAAVATLTASAPASCSRTR